MTKTQTKEKSKSKSNTKTKTKTKTKTITNKSKDPIEKITTVALSPFKLILNKIYNVIGKIIKGILYASNVTNAILNLMILGTMIGLYYKK